MGEKEVKMDSSLHWQYKAIKPYVIPQRNLHTSAQS